MRWRRSVVFWLLVIVLVILLLGLIFGGYRKGTRVGGLAPVTPIGTVVSAVR